MKVFEVIHHVLLSERKTERMHTCSCKGCEKRKTYPPPKKNTANAAKNDLILTVYKSRTPRARLAYRTLETISLHHRDGSTCHSYCHSPQNATRLCSKSVLSCSASATFLSAEKSVKKMAREEESSREQGGGEAMFRSTYIFQSGKKGTKIRTMEEN